MRVVFVLFDSLNRPALGLYGGAIGTPNFDRFATMAIPCDRFLAAMAGEARKRHGRNDRAAIRLLGRPRGSIAPAGRTHGV